MRKKHLLLLLAAMLLLAGCGKTIEETALPRITKTPRPIEDISATGPPDEPGFLNGTDTFEETSFKTSDTWRRENSGTTRYYYADDYFIMIVPTLTEMEDPMTDSDASLIFSSVLSSFSASELFTNVKEIEASRQIGSFGNLAISFEAPSYEQSYGRMHLFLTQDIIYNFTLMSKEPYDDETTALFEEFIASISLVDDAAIGPGGSTPVDSGKWYGEGAYQVGVDIPAGTYYYEFVDGFAFGYVVLTDGPDLEKDNVIISELVYTFVYITVYNGEYLTIDDDGRFIAAEHAPMPTAEGGVYPEGMYLVGRDIPAGKYKITPKEDDAYVHISKDARFLLSDTVDMDFFEGEQSFTVEEGQYFYVKYGTFAAV